ncbi:MAG: cyclic nucleotide-binding/CBS domain-containing protein [Thiothrix sp.]|nr:MAG: cyclic nucleotide-binding/CBS domain-containing protein [Thiothrix sp.]
MDKKTLEIRDYLTQCMPLKGLPLATLDELASSVEEISAEQGETIMRIGKTNDHVFLIRYGAVELVREDGILHGRFGAGDWFGHRSVIRGGEVNLTVRALEESLFYTLPGALFIRLFESYQRFASYFSEHKADRVRNALQELRNTDNHAMITLHVSDLMKPAMLVSKDTTIQKVAQQMNEHSSRTALVVDTVQHLAGIVTDADFRSIVAHGLDIHQPVTEIMTTEPLTLAPNNQASEALLLMARRNIRHVPVIEQGEIVGVISATDLLRGQTHSAIYLVADIYCAQTVARLSELSKSLPKVLVGLVKQSLPAYDIGHAITSIGQAIVRRLIAMAEQQFGKPPIPYAFIVAGSMARREQTAHTDQDNGMILSDAYHEAEHGQYFRDIAKFVSDGMNECGYVYCPGNIMATNDQWRQPLAVWRSYFNNWIDTPNGQALLNASIFFDLRCLYGDCSLLESLQEDFLAKTKSKTVFQAFMASNALNHRPPIGFFRGFVLDKESVDSDEKGMDMKKRGVVPVIDLARVYALAGGLHAVNTWERLDAIAASHGITQVNIDDLKDAFEFISMVRLQHQAKQIEQGQKPNNYVPPEELSALERRHLKDAFEVVSNLQGFMTTRYKADNFR